MIQHSIVHVHRVLRYCCGTNIVPSQHTARRHSIQGQHQHCSCLKHQLPCPRPTALPHYSHSTELALVALVATTVSPTTTGIQSHSQPATRNTILSIQPDPTQSTNQQKMPICINCTTPLPNLYTLTTSKAGSTIRLTQCPACKRFADKYVEHDYVVLFIDLVLVKREVLRHLLFNRGLNEAGGGAVANARGGVNGSASASTTATATTTAKRKKRYGLDESIWRLGVLLVLFDVYITWARVEQTGANATTWLGRDGNGSWSSWLPRQYLFFLTVNVLATLAQHFTVRGLARLLMRHGKWSGGWGLGTRMDGQEHRSGEGVEGLQCSAQTSSTGSLLAASSPDSRSESTTNGSAISTALLVSSCIKLFPILLVIWPTTMVEDDTPGATSSSSSSSRKGPVASRASSYITYFVLFNNIEALQILLNLGYVLSTALALSGIVARGIVESWLFLQVGLEREGSGLVGDMLDLLNWLRTGFR